MAFNRSRGNFRANRGYYVHGGPGGDPDERPKEPKVDKNPYYRTTDILNGVFHKKIRLEAGKMNCTDGSSTITVNFGEAWYRPIVELRGPGETDGNSLYRFDCGHDWEGKAGHPTDGSKKGPCWVCGSQQSYLGFEHEWQHIIFKSDMNVRALFVERYAEQLLKQAPSVDPVELKAFLSFFINAFDDLRCNSLWEKVYPGSAAAIWARWKRLTEAKGKDCGKDFLSFIFAVAFGVPTDPQGDFEAMRPVIEWGVQKVKYRGFANMLVDVRAVLDRCMGALLSKMRPQNPPPQPPQQPAPQQPQQQPGQRGGANAQAEKPDPQTAGQDAESGADSSGAGADPGSDGGSREGDGDDQGAGDASSGSGDAEEKVPPPAHVPSASQLSAGAQERSNALSRLMAGADKLDEKESHLEPDAITLQATLSQSQALQAMVAQALGVDVKDLDAIDQRLPDAVDQDMQAALNQLANTMVSKSSESQLTSGAKARILIVPVLPDRVDCNAIELSEEERFAVQRMRSSFYRSLGRQKAKRSEDGMVVDVPAAIQYMADHQDAAVFESEAAQQGFAYDILCDMSGSMQGTFNEVAHGAEMLKKALDFPFVVGNLWGFRGGSDVPGRASEGSEVWMYRYDRKCRGYIGMTKLTYFSSSQNRFNSVDMPVSCGGLTPMHSAINVAVTHLWRQMPASMAKRLFLLTDGSPCHTKINGGHLPEAMLRDFVAKEINLARRHGIQVYTIIIGQHSIEDDDCKRMFGPRQFWRKTETSEVYKALCEIVLTNFTRYIKARG